jgi:hypothetical protein
MLTPKFWQTVDRLGSENASLTLWRLELGDEFDQAMRYLRRLPRMADRIPDPDEPRRPWMDVFPSEKDGVYWAESEDSPPHREAFQVPASDLNILTPDWETIRPALAASLGFTPSARTIQHRDGFRQVGVSQPRHDISVPVFLHIPSGLLSDFTAFLAALQDLADCVLYVPTTRFMAPEVFTAAKARSIIIEPVADRLAQTGAATTLAVASTVEKRESNAPSPILAVQPGWQWESLLIKLTEKGTLVAEYGNARGTYQFPKSRGAEGRAKYSALFKILFQMCAAGRWENPPRADKTYVRTQRNFARLRELLKKLILIDGDPFRKIEGVWEPRFQFRPDHELAAAVEYARNTNRLADRRHPSTRHTEEYDEDNE